jgi:hypothetical protein
MFYQKRLLNHARLYACALLRIILMGLTKGHIYTLQYAKNKNTELPHQKQPYASCNTQEPLRLSTFPHQKQLYTHNIMVVWAVWAWVAYAPPPKKIFYGRANPFGQNIKVSTKCFDMSGTNVVYLRKLRDIDKKILICPEKILHVCEN